MFVKKKFSNCNLKIRDTPDPYIRSNKVIEMRRIEKFSKKNFSLVLKSTLICSLIYAYSNISTIV